jgi:hypothetical protein
MLFILEMGETLVMKSLEELLSQLAENAEATLSPVTEERLRSQGVNIPKPPERSLEESINLIFSEQRKEKALAIAKTLPEPPETPVPSIQSLYNEIRETIILGLNGAAITLSGILVEHALKYATYKVEIGGFAQFNPDKDDEFERFTLGPAIDRAAKAGLLAPDHVNKLRSFKDTYRNPYAHYNIKKIASNYYVEDVSVMNTKTGEVETRDIAAKDDQVIRTQIKPYVDADNALQVFIFADSVVKFLWKKISNLQKVQGSTEGQV